MFRMLAGATLLAIGFAPTQAQAVNFPFPLEGEMTDAGLGIIPAPLYGTVTMHDDDGVKPYEGRAELAFIIDYVPEVMIGTWDFSQGTYSCAIPDDEITRAFGNLLPPGTDISNATCTGSWVKADKCVYGTVDANVTFYGFPLGNITAANMRLCKAL